MKLITLMLIASSVIARAEAEGAEFYFSQMRWSSNPDPVDAGAVDGTYYADLMANQRSAPSGLRFGGRKRDAQSPLESR
jgi:hypothetical protein